MGQDNCRAVRVPMLVYITENTNDVHMSIRTGHTAKEEGGLSLWIPRCVCIPHLETLGTRLEDEKKACQRGQWDALGNVLLGSTRMLLWDAPHLSIVGDHENHLMEAIFPYCCGLFQQDYLPWYTVYIHILKKKKKLQEWFKENNNVFVMVTWPSNSPDVYLIKPLWDVLDNHSDPWRPQIPKSTLMGLVSPYLNVSGIFWQQMGTNLFFFYLRVLFLCLPLL